MATAKAFPASETAARRWVAAATALAVPCELQVATGWAMPITLAHLLPAPGWRLHVPSVRKGTRRVSYARLRAAAPALAERHLWSVAQPTSVVGPGGATHAAAIVARKLKIAALLASPVARLRVCTRGARASPHSAVALA